MICRILVIINCISSTKVQDYEYYTVKIKFSIVRIKSEHMSAFLFLVHSDL